jgi:two-component system NtrC family sensor kinase
MNNLLTVAMGWLELVLADEPRGGLRCESLQKVSGALHQMGRLTVNLLDFARAPAGVCAEVELNEVVQRVMELLTFRMTKHGITPATHLPEETVAVSGSEGELAQVIFNLVLNACQAMGDGGQLSVALRRENEHAVIDVADSGGGIPADVRDRIFHPFFTTRNGAGGTGLGLAVCREIVQRHDGELTFDTEEGRGTKFTVRLPVPEERHGGGTE